MDLASTAAPQWLKCELMSYIITHHSSITLNYTVDLRPESGIKVKEHTLYTVITDNLRYRIEPPDTSDEKFNNCPLGALSLQD
uniref:Uncharacterized protein n=1 Tax=Strigamia maritima TaxID=126957 RepID=T1J3W5_STRMM